MTAFTVVTATPSLTMTQIRKIFVPFPMNKQEQGEIALHVSKISDALGAERELLRKLRHQKHGLMHDLLTGRVR